MPVASTPLGKKHKFISSGAYFCSNRCNEFKIFCEKLLGRVSGLRLWAARCRHDCTPDAWRKEFFTQPLRFAPVVKRKVAKSGKFCTGNVRPYSCSNVPSPTDGPPVIHLNHDVVKHTCSSVYDCTQCGDLLASLLRSDFHIGQTGRAVLLVILFFPFYGLCCYGI